MYKAYKMDNYNLYMMKTDKFKTISMSIRFRKEKTKEDGVYTFILKDVLKSGTNGYEKLNEYYKAKLDIYYPTTNFQVINYGKERTFAITTKIVNEKYTEKGLQIYEQKVIINLISTDDDFRYAARKPYKCGRKGCR